jgi:hypothetical protein
MVDVVAVDGWCYRITCNCDRVVTNFLIRRITLFTYGLYLPLSVISSFGTPINIVNLALPTTHPYMDEVAFYIQNFACYVQFLQIEPAAG